jgi:hypothetical protein
MFIRGKDAAALDRAAIYCIGISSGCWLSGEPRFRNTAGAGFFAVAVLLSAAAVLAHYRAKHHTIKD